MSGTAMKILLLSPYDAKSHQYWRQGLEREIDHEFVVVTLPPRHFSWRFRGNSLTLAHDPRLNNNFDLIIATSMTDLSSLKGMRPGLSNVPTILYFHENQFAYPDGARNEKEAHLIERQITSLYSAIAANKLVFNSEYNLATFMAGVSSLLDRLPDGIPPDVVSKLQSKSKVLPVALDADCFRQSAKSPDFSIVWNHRWEFDKGTFELQKFIVKLLETDCQFKLHVIGQQFRQTDSVMLENIELLKSSGHAGEVGYIEPREKYLNLLAESHCVLSTSQHDFQGLAIQEGMAAGCIPIVPDDLAYPEYVPGKWRYKNLDEAVSSVQQVAGGETSCEVNLQRWPGQIAAWQDLVSGM